MKRKFYKELERWSQTKNKKPLMVIGARQVGKTYIIEKFGQENYKNYLYVNLLREPAIVNAFKENIGFEEKEKILQTFFNKPIYGEDTLLFIDEIQISEELIEALKFFCEDSKNYNIICAGALLGVSLREFSRSFPVGYIIIKNMYPLDFEEFLIATDNARYIPLIKESMMQNKSLGVFHSILLKLFNEFLYLGGMPEVVQAYIDGNKELVNVDNEIIENIMLSYYRDMGKYTVDEKESMRIRKIYDNICPQLAKENQKFMYSKIDNKDNRKRDYVSAMDWLTSSNLVFMCKLVTNPEYPILGFVDNESYKLYLSDTGLIRYILDIKAFDIITEGDYSFKGILTENYVACELIKMGFPLVYWSRKGTNKGNAEIDFLIQDKANVIPIEVKAGTDIKSKSLETYVNTYKPKYSIRISAKDFGFENNIKSIPLYAVFLLKDFLNEKDANS